MRILALLILCLAAATAQALPTVEDVEHAVHRGDYTAAESMTREVLAAKPDNAKAHYILAELLAHQGKLGEARIQAATAQQLDPAIHFTTPERFRNFQAQLGGAGTSRQPATSARGATGAAPSERAGGSSPSGGGVSMSWIVVLLGIGAVFLFMRRRPATTQGFGGNYPVPPNGMPGGPGYPGGTVYPNGPAQPGSGIGGTVVAGLGGIAAGMVAEHLIEEALDHRHHGQAQDGLLSSDNTAPQESLEDRPIDFGSGNDWGGDGGGDSSADSGGGFDSGSGGDWS